MAKMAAEPETVACRAQAIAALRLARYTETARAGGMSTQESRQSPQPAPSASTRHRLATARALRRARWLAGIALATSALAGLAGGLLGLGVLLLIGLEW